MNGKNLRRKESILKSLHDETKQNSWFHLFNMLYQFKFGYSEMMDTRFKIFDLINILTSKVLKLECSERAEMKDFSKIFKTIMDLKGFAIFSFEAITD